MAKSRRTFSGSPALLMTPAARVPAGSPPWVLSGRVEHPCPQEHEPRPTVHLPLDRLQAIHMPLHGSVAPPPRHRRVHRRLVTTDALGEPTQVRVRRGLTT